MRYKALNHVPAKHAREELMVSFEELAISNKQKHFGHLGNQVIQGRPLGELAERSRGFDFVQEGTYDWTFKGASNRRHRSGDLRVHCIGQLSTILKKMRKRLPSYSRLSNAKRQVLHRLRRSRPRFRQKLIDEEQSSKEHLPDKVRGRRSVSGPFTLAIRRRKILRTGQKTKQEIV